MRRPRILKGGVLLNELIDFGKIRKGGIAGMKIFGNGASVKNGNGLLRREIVF
jgi:hypothetical protein